VSVAESKIDEQPHSAVKIQSVEEVTDPTSSIAIESIISVKPAISF
jgi:hypothetical protein